MTQDELRRAIQLMQDGSVEPAAEELRRLVEAPTLDAKGRAAAYVWLAEAQDDRDYKRRCLERALACEPDNAQIRQGLNQLLAQPSQPEHLPSMRRVAGTPTRLEQGPPVVGVEGGRNGPASGAFVSRGGLLATTSYAVGSAEDLTVHLGGERTFGARVVRRYPLYDLAIIATGVELGHMPAAAPSAMPVENTAFVTLGFGGARIRGVFAAGGLSAAGHWLETNIPPDHLPDAGGNPLMDENGHLLGILTRNIGPRGYACALKITHVLALAEKLRRERQLMPKAGYCPACGGLARALLFGGATCETCGARLAATDGHVAQSEELNRLYGENAAPPCAGCGARVGSNGGRCLRCGYAPPQRGAG